MLAGNLVEEALWPTTPSTMGWRHTTRSRHAIGLEYESQPSLQAYQGASNVDGELPLSPPQEGVQRLSWLCRAKDLSAT
jgi:hypothetical protein